MQKFNIMVAKTYTDRQGQEKTQWVKIGSLVDNGVDQNGKRKLFGNIDAVPTFEWDGSINLFEQEMQNNNGNGYQQNQPQGQYQQPPQQYQAGSTPPPPPPQGGYQQQGYPQHG